MLGFWILPSFFSFFWDLCSSVITFVISLLSWIILQKHPPSTYLLSSYICLDSNPSSALKQPVITLIVISNHADVVSVETTTQLFSYISSCGASHLYPFTSLSVLAEQIHFTKRIHNVEVNELQSATFECEVSFDNAIVSWYKDTWELKESPKYNFTSEGRRHFMVIKNVTIEDEGV